MPIIAKLSRRFYDQFGEDVVNELVNWLNQVDATYRSGFSELNELSFERFEAKLEQRVAQLDARIDKLDSRIDKLDSRIDKLDSKFEQRFTKIEARIDGLESKFEQRFTKIDARIDKLGSDIETLVHRELRTQQRVLIGLTVGLWMSLLIPIIGLSSR